MFQTVDFVNHTVDEGRDAVDEEYLGPVLHVTLFVVLQMRTGNQQFFVGFFNLLLDIADNPFVIKVYLTIPLAA